jgi:DNA repair protein RadA/Sms
MAKSDKTSFLCESCGATYIKWMGKCTSCNEWNTIKQFRESRSVSVALDPRAPKSQSTKWIRYDSTGLSNETFVSLDAIANPSPEMAAKANLSNANHDNRLSVFSEELNRVLGGGIVKGSVVLLAGEPGIGKSTLLLQLALKMKKKIFIMKN